MDEEVDELGDGLEDLGIGTYVEFLYYAELCETFWRIVKEQITGLSRSVIRHTLHFDN